MKLKNIFVLPAICFALGFASCSDSNNWTPGPESEGSVGAYFSTLPSTQILLSNLDEMSTDVTISRLDASQAAIVPLIATSNVEGFTVPASVSFAAGEESVTFKVDFSKVPLKTDCQLTVAVDPAYVNEYAAGASSFSTSVTVSEWKVVASDVQVSYSTKYSPTTTTIYILDGTDQMKIMDFLGSGLDLTFKLSDTSKTWPSVLPIANVKTYKEVFPDDSDDYECWYLYDDAKGEYPVWSPDRITEPQIEYAMFYGTGYCYLGIAKGYGEFCAWAEYTDGTAGWFYAYLDFTATYNPFANN